ncbi:hypothetical protein RRG08_036417 [Elysia crispata]|uniref:Reverse transcriptase domain-containing protein n=1 Tax=Elysia crispata TaxID=231223 RepID=A0AAE0ZL75_9GAST|nr:hypothetical protein RRG08_036417 [Elysia crispata]
MVRPHDLFQEIGSRSKYLTKVDLSKGYWQIPLAEKAKPLTAFATEKGLYQFRVMPFGLQGAPATFSRLMRKVTDGTTKQQKLFGRFLNLHRNIGGTSASITSIVYSLESSWLDCQAIKMCNSLPSTRVFRSYGREW